MLCICQVAQANAQTKTWWQRVSVPPHNRQTIREKDRRAAANSGLTTLNLRFGVMAGAVLRMTVLCRTAEAVGSSSVLRLNFCAKNPPLRQATNRCHQF